MNKSINQSMKLLVFYIAVSLGKIKQLIVIFIKNIDKIIITLIQFFALIALVSITALVLYWIYTKGPNEINIEINIGEIIGGTLIGTGSLIAGKAYAIKNNINNK